MRKFYKYAKDLCNNAQMESWDDLKYALAVHRHGGLSGAARALGVNHSTVSRRLSALEDRMGARLFDRLPHGLKATTHGERAIETAQTIEKHLHELDRSIAAKDSTLAGPLKISVPQLIFQIQLADIIRDFKVTYPQIDLTIIATSDSVNLHQREADVSIRASNEPESSLWGRKVLSQNCRYYGAADYLENRTDPKALNCINFMWRGDEPAPHVLKTYPNSKVVAKFDDMIAVIGAVQSGFGVARMPCFVGDSLPNVQPVKTLTAEPYTDIWVLCHPDLKDIPRIQTFMRFVAQELKNRQDQFQGSS